VAIEAREDMANSDSIGFLAGIIEGFYGQPWNQRERFELFDLMAAWNLNTYLYAPKDDLKHRAIWREAYSAEELASLEGLIQRCQARGIHFIYALSPGLEIRYSDASEKECLQKRFEQMLASGCEHFALLFDDIPDRMPGADRDKFGSFASAQCHVANLMFEWTRGRSPRARFLFCPTSYCGRMAERKLGGADYLETIGRELLPEIDVLWTGPEIISREITVSHIEELQRILRRKPLIWDNLHANDYDGRRFYCGPYAGRAPELRPAVNGVLINPNCEFPLNFVPFRTFARFVQCEAAWDPRKEYLAAMEEWLAHFETIHRPMTLADLVLLGDCYYLPFEEGAEAEAFFQRTRRLLAANPKQWGEDAAAFRQQSARLREFSTRMAELKHRPLFHALSRRVWELREELDLLERYVTAKGDGKLPDAPCTSDFHLPGTYRGGMVSRLQRLLEPHPDGTFTPAQGFETFSDSTS
jgi:protein O-GlcNAcase/histone acetyltransferase